MNYKLYDLYPVTISENKTRNKNLARAIDTESHQIDRN